MSRILIDNGSSDDVIFLKLPKMMGINESELDENNVKLTDFNEKTTTLKESIKLQVIATRVSKLVDFLVMDCLPAFNIILGRPQIHSMKAVPSTYHYCIIFFRTRRYARD